MATYRALIPFHSSRLSRILSRIFEFGLGIRWWGTVNTQKGTEFWHFKGGMGEGQMTEEGNLWRQCLGGWQMPPARFTLFPISLVVHFKRHIISYYTYLCSPNPSSGILINVSITLRTVSLSLVLGTLTITYIIRRIEKILRFSGPKYNVAIDTMRTNSVINISHDVLPTCFLCLPVTAC